MHHSLGPRPGIYRSRFVLPFVKNPEAHPTFEIYFTKPWLDTFMLSLNNFLRTVLENIPLPTLLSFDDEQLKLRAMADEIETLRSTQLTTFVSRSMIGDRAWLFAALAEFEPTL